MCGFVCVGVEGGGREEGELKLALQDPNPRSQLP